MRQQHDVAWTDLTRRTVAQIFKRCSPTQHDVKGKLPFWGLLIRDAPRGTVRAANFQFPGHGDDLEQLAEPIHGFVHENFPDETFEHFID